MTVVVNVLVQILGWFLGWVPWCVLFLSAWKRSVLPTRWADELFGRDASPVALCGKIKYPVVIGALSLYLNLILWVVLVQGEVIGWEDFPRFCIEPRTFWGFMHIHQAPWHHFGFVHFGSNNLFAWLLGPLVLAQNRRTFMSATLFVGLSAGALVWLFGPDGQCYAGFSLVLFGWFGVLTMSVLLEATERREKILHIIAAFLLAVLLVGSVCGGLIKDDDSDGVSWYGHVFGVLCGLIYGYLRFERSWFLRPGFEDRVRPIGADIKLRGALQGIARDIVLVASRESAMDLRAMFSCRARDHQQVDEECTPPKPSTCGASPSLNPFAADGASGASLSAGLAGLAGLAPNLNPFDTSPEVVHCERSPRPQSHGQSEVATSKEPDPEIVGAQSVPAVLLQEARAVGPADAVTMGFDCRAPDRPVVFVSELGVAAASAPQPVPDGQSPAVVALQGDLDPDAEVAD